MFDKERNQLEKEWVSQWQKGDPVAAEKVLCHYMPLIGKLSHTSCQRLDIEDVRQELILYFLETAKSYDPEKNPSFSGYAVSHLRWKALNVVKRQKHCDDLEILDEESMKNFSCEDTYSIDMEYLLQEIMEKAEMTPQQRTLFLLWMHGDTMQDIGIKMHQGKAAVSRMKQRIRDKLQRHKEAYTYFSVG